jgi:D-serine deaminase-like pyridoxal phosphate-dependent protein
VTRTRDYQYYRSIFAGQAMPFAFVDLDLLQQNINDIIPRAADKKIRVASKSVRSVAILEKIFAANPIFQGIMCFTVPEALYLSQKGFDDLLIGYPCWHPDHITALCQAAKNGKTIVPMLDSVAHVEHLNTIAAQHDVVLPVCLDIDCSVDFPGLHFGVWRSGVTSPESALSVFQAIQNSPHLRLDGIMGYEAQIAGVGDNASGQFLKNAVIRFLKKRSLKPIAERRASIVNTLTQHGAELRFVNGGGTGSMESTCQESVVTEVTVGSGFYSSALFDNYRHFKHQPAAAFAIEIVRQPKAHIFTCHGGGYIASGATGNDKQPLPYLPQGATLTPLEGAGEVQTPIRYSGPETLALGDPIFLRHSKAGELCERFNTLFLVSDGKIVDQTTTYRGEGYSFL